ncbi:Uncharacterised protein [Mycobacteroides abscessus subsp. abscessus]|nr:Uncharacterised protein [Mycobacteroides abscessus subsp. abscessus]
MEGGYDEAGDFMLTTVRMGRANIYSYLTAKVACRWIMSTEGSM